MTGSDAHADLTLPQSCRVLFAVVLVLTAVAVAGNWWVVGNLAAWAVLNPLYTACAGVIIGLLALRGDTHERIIKYTLAACVILCIGNLALAPRDITVVWHLVDSLLPAAFVWFAYRLLRPKGASNE